MRERCKQSEIVAERFKASTTKINQYLAAAIVGACLVQRHVVNLAEDAFVSYLLETLRQRGVQRGRAV